MSISIRIYNVVYMYVCMHASADIYGFLQTVDVSRIAVWINKFQNWREWNCMYAYKHMCVSESICLRISLLEFSLWFCIVPTIELKLDIQLYTFVCKQKIFIIEK